MPLLQRRFNPTTVEARSWIGKYIPSFYVDIITYPCNNPDAGLANGCKQTSPQAGTKQTTCLLPKATVTLCFN